MTPAASQSSQPPGKPPPPSGPRPGSRFAWRWWLPAGLAAVFLALGTSAALSWRQHQLVARIQAALPALPDLSGKPAELAERLAKAQAQARSPRNRTALAGVAELGRLYQANACVTEAETCWRLLLAAQPREARWGYYLADLRRTAGDNAEMIALMERTTRLAPDYSPAWLHLADLQLKSNQLADAERNYQQRLALLPGDPYARLGLTRVALQEGRRDQARSLVEQLVKDVPEFSSAHNLFAEMLATAGEQATASQERWLGRNTTRFREAADPWMDELSDWCYDFERLCVLGSIETQTHHRDRASALYERAIRLRPDDAGGYELLASMYLEADDPAKARDTLEGALRRLAPSKPSVILYVDLAHAYRSLKQPAEAVRVIRLGMDRLGDQYELFDGLGVALGDLGRHEEAVAALRAAVAHNPNDANSNFNLAVALLAVKKLDDAMVALHRSLALRPTFPNTLALLAQIEIDSGRWQDATKYLLPLYESHPERIEARNLMTYWHLLAGMDAEKKGDLAAAAQHFHSGMVIEPNQPELQARFGTLCLIQGRFADAIPALEAYHRLQPNNPQSALYLGQAYAATGRRDEARQVLTEGAQLADRAGNRTTAQHCREILQHL